MEVNKQTIPQELLQKIEKAREAGKKAEAMEPRAQSAYYDAERELIIIKLKNGAIFGFPPALAQGLGEATPSQISDFWIPASGDSIHWDDLDVHLGIPQLIAGVFGTKAWMAELGRHGGRSKSPTKVAAARENGKKGGRPRKNLPVS